MLSTDLELFRPQRYRMYPWRMRDGFQETFNQRSTRFPLCNLWESAEGAILTAEIPGMNAQALNISVQGTTLILRGNLPEHKKKAGEIVISQERSRRTTFTRQIDLGFRVDPSKVVATYKRGVVEVLLPRSSEDRVHQIKVRSA
ncbi:MAG: Hsp20/alpha crystallin family protein [Myxococcota bacterium]